MSSGAKATPNNHRVSIVDRCGHVDQEEVHVQRDLGEQVIWCSTTADGFRVVFDGPEGSPFDRDTFEVPPNGSVYSGQGQSGGRFKYTVHGPEGSHDPYITLRP